MRDMALLFLGMALQCGMAGLLQHRRLIICAPGQLFCAMLVFLVLALGCFALQ
jgi:hypothetical protein